MAAKKKNTTGSKSIEAVTHEEDKRKNIPTLEHRSFMHDELKTPVQVAYTRRNPDLDPQLVWRGKDPLSEEDLTVQAPPIYIQEKVHPKAIIADLLRESKKVKQENAEQFELFGDFNGIPKGADRTEFYQHDQNWTNRMILGDSLQVMASLSVREGLRGKVQCIYFDPPYGIKFNSNFQWSTTSRDVKDGNATHITREPEQVKAFRDTWKDGIHSYLTYLRDRLTVARELLTDSGSIFVQIGDENVHRVRVMMDEVFGEDNYLTEIKIQKTGSSTGKHIQNVFDTVLWFFKNRENGKSRALKAKLGMGDLSDDITPWLCADGLGYRKLSRAELASSHSRSGLTIFQPGPINSQHPSETRSGPLLFEGESFTPPPGRQWTYDPNVEMKRLGKANYLIRYGKTLRVRMYRSDDDYSALSNLWTDTQLGGLSVERVYVVQTSEKIIQRCMLMTTDPGDLVLDPTCGSGTTATVAEQWGRRWITIDTSRVALALARSRIMGARYPYYLLGDSKEGQEKEASLSGTIPSSQPTFGNIKHGFVYERVPHITLKSIANNAEIDVIWEKWQAKLEPLREALNQALGTNWQEWEIPRELNLRDLRALRGEKNFTTKDTKSTKGGEEEIPRELAEKEIANLRDLRGLRGEKSFTTKDTKSTKDGEEEVIKLHGDWWQARISRQKEIDASIAAKADMEKLYDKPYENKSVVRVAGPFTVESLSPHRMISPNVEKPKSQEQTEFLPVILDNLRTAGVQFAHKADKIDFVSLVPWPGELICAEGKYISKEGKEIRAAIFVGPEYGTLTRPDLVEAAREASEAGFHVLISCAFNYEAHASEFDKLGKIPVYKARMNADLHMAEDLRNNGKGNLFVVFGEPEIDILYEKDGMICVTLKGIDVFDPNTGEVRSDGADTIACWFVDTDYNEESFFVRQAYFLGAGDPYKSLKTSLKAEINEEAWASLYSDTSRPFEKPESGRIAVKVINHLGDEVMKVFKVDGK